MKKLACLFLSLTLILSGTTFGFAASTSDAGSGDQTYMQEVVKTIGEEIDGQEMFDYLSYVYLGWRTTGGKWQNNVIEKFVTDQLTAAGYKSAGVGNAATSNEKSANDKSSAPASEGDYTWVTYFNDVTSLTWEPEYAKLDVTLDADFEGKDALIKKVNIESSAFNPLSDAYQAAYGKNVDEMWQWITEKDADGNRVNVLNGKEAELNKRVHLAWNSCFTDPAGTKPADADGVTGEIVWVGTISRSGSSYASSVVEDLTTLEGKVLFTDSSLSNAFNLAKQVGAVAVMSKASLGAYSTPKNSDGTFVEPFGDSARYASGANLATTSAQTGTGKPIVEWQLSNNQYNALKTLLEEAAKAGKPLMAKNIAIGEVYAMNSDITAGVENPTKRGQAINVAEIKGSTKPDERVFLCAHVQEPSSNDNATGVATLLGIATTMKRLIDEGKLERPERTITFMWGDEMSMARLYLSSHPEESKNIKSVLDLDMTGEDPDKTGGVMRIEKTPDPSAVYNYTLDTLPWLNEESYDETYKDGDGNFTRLPDSHTLWGAGSTNGIFNTGFYLNDLYMYATRTVIDNHDDTFQVDVCPYEGGSDHSVFLKAFIPAMLTWHFTDYTYHTSVDTLAMSSADEMENVGLTSISAGMAIANATDSNEAVAKEMLTETYDAALERCEKEELNTVHHRIYADANSADLTAEYAQEREVLQAWSDWYQEALLSVEDTLLDSPSRSYKNMRDNYQSLLLKRTSDALGFAKDMMTGDAASHKRVKKMAEKAATCTEDGNIACYYCMNCGKYFEDKECTKELAAEDVITAATGHNYVKTYVKATPTADGSMTESCTACGDVKSTSVVYKVSNIKLAYATTTYNGNSKKPAVIVKNSKGYIIKPEHYTVVYGDSGKAVGTHKVTVKFQGEKYKGSKTLYFKTVPVKPTDVKVVGAKGSFTASWKSVPSIQRTGYQVRYSKYSTMKNAKIVSTTKTSRKVTKLSKGKYYVQVRTYKTVNGQKYYSAWTYKKSVTVK